MVFYFSGTGNSLYVAKNIAEKQRVELVSMAEALQTKQLIFVPNDGEPVGFVFPIYGWAPPKIVFDFIRRVQLARKNNYIFAVCTYAHSVGNAMEYLRDVLMSNQIPLNADFSVKMPNNFILVYDIVNKDIQEAIITKADNRLNAMNEVISKRRSAMDSYKGNFAGIKTRLLNPAYMKMFKPAKKYTTTSYCDSCGECLSICPTKNICFDEFNKPLWNDNCISCLACINRCPRQAIECGHATKIHGRYYNPRGDKKNDHV
ncbi:MAG: EFR1 family ferrodoxin [Oscillospiraceae bacterium]